MTVDVFSRLFDLTEGFQNCFQCLFLFVFQ